MEIKQTENGNEGMFVAYDGEERMGHISYVWDGESQFSIHHTVVEAEHEGKGVGTALLNFAADYARRNGKKIRAVCPFVVAKFSKSGAYDDVKAL